LILEIRTIGDPVLREKCRNVESVDEEVKGIIEQMSETLAGSPGRVGLAACQIGVLKRLFVYDLGQGTHCLINPEIVEAGNETVCEEGCLSIPGIYVSIPRFERVKVRGTTPSGHDVVIEAEGFVAQVLQHECDHLDGVLIIDRCDAEERKKALAEYQELKIQREQASA
jgi:peptide deformylase